MNISSHHRWMAGLSVVELVVWIALAGLLIVGVSVLLGTGLSSNRFQFEQVLITEDARRQLELMSDTLRNVRNDEGNNWLIAASDNDVTVRTDIDGNNTLEQVRYFLDGNNLKRGLTPSGGTEQVRIVARSIRNNLSGDVLFKYYDAEGNQISASSATSATVERIELQISVNVSEQQEPGSGEVLTEVKPRAEDTQIARLWPVTLSLPSNPTSYPATGGSVTVTTTNPSTNTSTSTIITMADLADGRVGTYTNDYYVHLNYQDQSVGSYLPDWYAWVGPITVGTSGSTKYKKTDKFPLTQLCLNSTLDLLLTTCSVRQISDSGYTKQYFPILTYTHPGGTVDYVRAINYVGI